MTKEKRIFLAVTSLLVGMGLGAVALLLNPDSGKKPYQSGYSAGATPPPVAEPSPAPLVELPPRPAPGEKEVPHFTFYRVVEGPEGPVLRPDSHPLPADAANDETRIKLAIDSMAQGESAALPKGTHLLRLERDGETALFDLSKELKENFSGSDRAERLIINALTATAAQLAGVTRLRIFIEGEAVETLGGDQSLLEPLTVPRS